MTITIQKASNGWIVTVMATSGSLAGQLCVSTIATDATLLDVVAQVAGIEREPSKYEELMVTAPPPATDDDPPGLIEAWTVWCRTYAYKWDDTHKSHQDRFRAALRISNAAAIAREKGTGE